MALPLTPPPQSTHKHKTLKIAFLKLSMTLLPFIKKFRLHYNQIAIKSNDFLKPAGNSALRFCKHSKSLTGRL
ncbi:hypothetical protein C2S36_05815 [Helicobacter pylori]|nr:hypothetical protein C2S36_05815 [Helicobacter pylori]